jgi:hypothetical protein
LEFTIDIESEGAECMKRLLLIMVGFSLTAIACGVKTAEKKCDRKCLINLMDQYLAALVKHDPSGVPLAANVQFVENAESIGDATLFSLYKSRQVLF